MLHSEQKLTADAERFRAELDDDAREEFDDFVQFLRFRVWSGFHYDEEILESATEAIADGMYPELEEIFDEKLINQIVNHEVKEKLEDEKQWPAMTDCDRLTRAFGKLNANGIVALESAGYSIGDGWDEYREAVHAQWELKGLLDSVRGGCFYHEQDLERAVAGNGLQIAYSAASGNFLETLGVAKEVVDVLEAEGLSPAWNGNVEHRIQLPIKWQRRSPR
ncbi:MAG: hypothetical protein SGJ27_21850 [Candidatus Melainabacteria bacterium]|nr:hypothetical protein [Candidatus Melainabacteria bacterium]